MGRKFAFLPLVALTAVVLLLAANANAIPWYKQDPAIKPGIPDFDDPDGRGGVECAEIAAANVISYWDSHGLPNLVADGTTPGQLMKDLINYDVRSDMKRGLKKYFKDKGYNNLVLIRDIKPTWNNVIDELKKCEMLTLSFVWYRWGHVVTVAGWDETPSKQLGFHDPNDPAHLNGADYTYSKDNTDFYKVELSNGFFHSNIKAMIRSM